MMLSKIFGMSETFLNILGFLIRNINYLVHTQMVKLTFINRLCDTVKYRLKHVIIIIVIKKNSILFVFNICCYTYSCGWLDMLR